MEVRRRKKRRRKEGEEEVKGTCGSCLDRSAITLDAVAAAAAVCAAGVSVDQGREKSTPSLSDMRLLSPRLPPGGGRGEEGEGEGGCRGSRSHCYQPVRM